jgi:hypothetical protein
MIVKTIPTLFMALKATTVLQGTLHYTPSSDIWIQSAPSDLTSLKSVLVLSSHLHGNLQS